MTTPTIFVPRDAAAVSLGADEVAAAFVDLAAARGLAPKLVRNGSRGMLWLEPLVEVDTPTGRVAFGPVRAEDVPGLVDAGLLAAETAGRGLPAALAVHPLHLGSTFGM